MSAEQLQKKRCRWLQLHDQQTAGLPGLLPLYQGMRLRVTERLSKKLSILKHAPCTLIGWDLHPADKTTSQDGQRMLQELPVCFYLQFEGATWRIHQNLPVGVFPLKPVKRSWLVNRQTEAKADRRGFQVLPDYACTAHMIQGATLLRLLADCGDVLDIPMLKDMLASYVTLFRVRSADGLLLLRAFSALLFKQGPPPGPHVLMKFLRARLHSSAGSYTFDDATEEFKTLTDEWTRAKEMRKETGHAWACSECSCTYPAEGFGARTTKIEEIFEACVKPGQWIACTACAEARGFAKENRALLMQRRFCHACAVEKSCVHFDMGNNTASWCRQCNLQRSFEYETCINCRKRKRCTEFSWTPPMCK